MTTTPLGVRESLAVLDGCPGRLSGRERHEILRLAEGDRRALVALHDAVLHGTRREDGSRIPDTTRIHADAGLGELSEEQRLAALALPGDKINFEDPLVRVAARHAIPLIERRRLYAQLAAESAADPVRAAWYRSEAALGDTAARIADLTLVAQSGETWADAVRCWEKAAELAPDPTTAATHLLSAATAALATAEPARVAWLCRRLAAATSDPQLLAAGSAVTGIALSRCGAAEAAAKVFTEARVNPDAFLAAEGPIGLRAEAVIDRIDDLIATARWDDALALIDELDAHAATGRWTALEVDLTAQRATVHALRGEPASLGRIWQLIDLAENPASHVRLLRAAALLATAAGDWAGVYRHFRAMFTPSGAPVHAVLSVRCIAGLAGAAARCGQTAEAGEIIAALRGASLPPDDIRLRLLLHRAEALTSDRDTEQHHRLAAIDPAGEQWPLERALGRLHYGQWLRRRRRPTEARELVQAALETFELLRATPFAEMARAELRAGGHVSEQDRPDDPLSALTPQERQIIVLAAGGLPNRAIAEQLLISARTVGSHLYKAYPKLGIDGRHQLANLISR